ncbi:hypothetical protein GE09DRAFT_976891 [Coniochaeta sp. 2T2.1]|nr:hypothetical protein GE09DRAFT_976891 [Coniochaeta sp. 2T2.1]
MADTGAGSGADFEPDLAQFPNTRRRLSTTGSTLYPSSSRQNETAADANPKSNPPSDVDTCRICRGEGTPDEPLFYPCKCSGSIKYVHQECLMQWLSHSQKKHCELCKTPFRFTKLYAPNMPKALPFHIFISHVAQYLLRNMLVWLRAALVISVWLGWLPYLMRSVWSFLFWVSDEGFSRNSSIFGHTHDRTTQITTLSSLATNGVCPSSPLFPVNTSPTWASIAGQITPDSVPSLVRALYALNITMSESRYATFLRLVTGRISGSNSTVLPGSADTGVPAHPSLLSEVGFLRNLTRHPRLNRVVIATLEGQIITILVVVCFILIILVRDYVVQQQPEINMRAAFAAGENEPLVQQPEDQAHDEENEDLPPLLAPEPVEDATNNLATYGNPEVHDTRGETPPMFRGNDAETAEWVDEDYSPGMGPNLFYPPAPGENVTPPVGGLSRDQPGFSEEEETTVRQFMRIYREADGDPKRILELAKEQHLEDKLEWWMDLTRSRIARHTAVTETTRFEDLFPGPQDQGSPWLSSATSDSHSFDRDQHPEHDHELEAESFSDKGKARADVGSGSMHVSDTQNRPRAHTDGLRDPLPIHPLAHNSWSFADLPQAPPSRPSGATPVPDLDLANAPQPAVAGATQPDEPDFDFNTPPGLGVRPQQQQQPAGLVGHEPDLNWNAHPGLDVRPPPRRQPAGLVGRVADFMWGDVEAIDPAELVPLHVPEELHEHEEAPFFDAPEEADILLNDERDREVIEAAVAAGLDPDAIEDAEDLEGILELLGMRGPIAGLFQNAIFCAFLVAVTLLVGVFTPYTWGRIAVWVIANPMRLVLVLFSVSKFVQDVAVICFGLLAGFISYFAAGWWKLLGQSSSGIIDTALQTSFNMSSNAATRVVESFMSELPMISASEIRNFSAVSHAALLDLKACIYVAFLAAGQAFEFVFGGGHNMTASDAVIWFSDVGSLAWDAVKELPHTLSDPSSWVINLSLPESADVVNPDLAYWGGMDRFWAILCGYISFSALGALYLRRGVPFSSTPALHDLEHTVLDALKQASGVMKVILIIGIEMLAFPLYCGLLLDVALLPLFENTTVKSRLMFTVNYPLTSIFVHWFVGTGYMFHFALFVSMCRKIMRRGVLYFIRDPDDPEFHPVRDVLERNVTTQLRKILFSAFVYGALVIICLGGVVWGLSYSIPNVLPIHYSSNEPVLEFPIDLLFYNFLMPLAVRFFKPSDGLHAMYTWWFRKCARALRLTWFLFGERRIDEEGVLVLHPESIAQQYPWWRKLFLEVDGYTVTPTTWRDFFEGGKSKAAATMTVEQLEKLDMVKRGLRDSGQIIPDGRFVRTPASDQVKIPKGRAVFLEVTESDERLDQKPEDSPETDIYLSPFYARVYIPPFFRVRVFLFIMFIWLFAAFTGVGITIVPLVFGRAMFKLLIPTHIRTNDIYAFSIGIYILGSFTYSVSHTRSILQNARMWLGTAVESVTRHDAARKAIGMVVHASRLLFSYFFLLIVFPMMVVSLMELYLLIPLNTWMYSAVFSTPALPVMDSVSGPGVVAAASVANINPKHTIRVIQSWTIGLLYLKLGARVISTWYEDTRLSAAVRAVLRRGWMDPDVAVLTRAFVIPGLVIWATLVSAPLLVGRMLVAYGATESIIAAVADSIPSHRGILDTQLASAITVLLYRLSYPLTALAVATAAAGWNLIAVFQGWKIRIRDEAYLIGERLHNFSGANGGARARGAWRAGGGRL